MTDLKNKVADFIRTRGLFTGCPKVLAAVSGGADSVALLYVLIALKNDGFFAGDIVCGHINHQLRGADADRDEHFVAQLCQNVGVEMIAKRVDVTGHAQRQKLSIETAARLLRRQALLDIANEKNISTVVTAHHTDDNAETIIQRFARGTGIRGLAGIWPARQFDGVRFVRPMLNVTRDQIEEFLRTADIPWMQDHTNADCTYRRNFIRHKIIPAINENYKGDLAADLFELSQAARAFYKKVCQLTDAVWPRIIITDPDRICDKHVRIDADVFVALHSEMQVEILRRVLSMLDCGQQSINRCHFQRIIDRTRKPKAGKILELPGQVRVWYQYGALVFTTNMPDQNAINQTGPLRIKVPGQTKFADYTITAQIVGADEVIPFTLGRSGPHKPKRCCGADTECFDLDKLHGVLIVRSRSKGDRFVPFGQTGHKKVGKFLTDQRIDKSVRNNVLIIADEQQIVWVWPVRISEIGRVTEDTKRVLKLSVTQNK